jgi:hypothetical protein
VKTIPLFLMLGILLLVGCGTSRETGQKSSETSPDRKSQTEQGATRQQWSSEQSIEQEPGPDRELTNVQEHTVAVAGSCAAGTPETDLVAKGKVEDIVVRNNSSLVEVRVDKVLKGNAGDKLVIRTQTGTQVATSVDVQFKEGFRYLLRLNRSGKVYTTNVCLGTQPLSFTEQ